LLGREVGTVYLLKALHNVSAFLELGQDCSFLVQKTTPPPPKYRNNEVWGIETSSRTRRRLTALPEKKRFLIAGLIHGAHSLRNNTNEECILMSGLDLRMHVVSSAPHRGGAVAEQKRKGPGSRRQMIRWRGIVSPPRCRRRRHRKSCQCR